VKRILLAVSISLFLLNTLAVPTAVRADTGNGGGNCSGSTSNCKP
jgi:hypothetical protein